MRIRDLISLAVFLAGVYLCVHSRSPKAGHADLASSGQIHEELEPMSTLHDEMPDFDGEEAKPSAPKVAKTAKKADPSDAAPTIKESRTSDALTAKKDLEDAILREAQSRPPERPKESTGIIPTTASLSVITPSAVRGVATAQPDKVITYQNNPLLADLKPGFVLELHGAFMEEVRQAFRTQGASTLLFANGKLLTGSDASSHVRSLVCRVEIAVPEERPSDGDPKYVLWKITAVDAKFKDRFSYPVGVSLGLTNLHGTLEFEIKQMTCFDDDFRTNKNATTNLRFSDLLAITGATGSITARAEAPPATQKTKSPASKKQSSSSRSTP